MWKNNLVFRVVPGCFGEVWWRKRGSMKKIPKKNLFNRVNCNLIQSTSQLLGGGNSSGKTTWCPGWSQGGLGKFGGGNEGL